MKTKLHLKLLLLYALLFGLKLHAQWQNGLWIEKQAYNWHFGVKAGLNFNTSPPTAISNSAIIPDLIDPDAGYPGSTFISGTGSISDAEGNLLFYTNGRSIWNANNELMPNGAYLEGDINVMQNGLIVPIPANPGHYYVFTNVGWSGGKVVYCEVDMSLNGGLGDVTDTKNIEIATSCDGKMSATYHSDGEQVWVLFQTAATNEIKAFLISESGISATPVISNVGLPSGGNSIMKVSPDGTKIACTTPTFAPTKNVQVFNFDNETGQITSSLLSIVAADLPGELFGCMGIEFSPNSRFIYTTSVFTGKIYQYDLAAGTEEEIKASKIIIGQSIEDINNTLQLGPDGKIYVAHGGFILGIAADPYVGSSSTLNVIEYPNNAGLASGFVENAIDLGEGRDDASIPYFIQNYFASGILYDSQCAGSEVLFSTIRIPGITEITWDFGDPESGDDNTSTELEPFHIFNEMGTYIVTATITSNGAQQIATTQVVVGPQPEAGLPNETNITKCADNEGNAVFNLITLNQAILGEQNADDYAIAYFASEADREANNPIANPESFSTPGQIVYAAVINNETGCSALVQFELVVNPLPEATVPVNLSQCSKTFDLTVQDNEILNGQSSETFSVVYYASEADAEVGNAIGEPSGFTSLGQAIFAKVVNNTTGCTSSLISFIIEFTEAEFVENFELKQCPPFDLTVIEEQVEEGLSLSFYNNNEDALNDTNSITDPQAFYPTENDNLVYIRAENTEGCVDIGEIHIISEDCFIQRGISPNGDTRNDFFDLSFMNVEKLSIFNRYGTQVYTKNNYTTEWHGQEDNGSELPTGTYYYMIELATGVNETGWIYINREQ